MFSLFGPLFVLLEIPKSPLLQFWFKLKGHGIFPIGIVLGLVVLYAARYFTSPYRNLPPGPRGYPIIGNLLELRSKQWLKFTEWRTKYGELIYLNACGQPIIVLNSQRVAADLLDRRAAIYSDRPRFIVACDIMTGGLGFAFSPYGELWHRMRRAANEGFTKGSVMRFHEKQMAEAVFLGCDWLSESAKWDHHLRRAAVSVTASVVYGYPTIKSDQDPTVEFVHDLIHRVTCAALPGAHLVEFLPWMRHIPSGMARWKRDAETGFRQDSATLEGLLQTVEDNVAKGDDYESLGAMLVNGVTRNKLSLRERSWVAGTMYVAGGGTIAAVMAWWTLAMLAYPETQARAQAELDAVVGRSRPPTFADYQSLPYIRAMVKEVLRWRPSGPMGLPHQAIEDDWYEGMFIPKGAICIPNVWHLNRDPEVYGENAVHFDPARHLDANGDIAPGPSDAKEEGHVSYGFGRRLCIGRYVANDSLFINIAILLWACKIERKKNESGQLLPLDTDGQMEHGIVVRPVPFECDISPRFSDAGALLAQERELRGL